MNIKKGFTLIELIVVIAIIAILALILVPQVTGYIANANEVVCLSNRKQLVNDISRGYALGDIDESDIIDNDGESVSGISELLGVDYSNAEGYDDGWKLSYKNGIIDVVCNEHSDSTGDSGDSSDDDSTPVEEVHNGTITLTDNFGGIHVLTSTLNIADIIDNFAENKTEFSVKNGTTITDGTNTYYVQNDTNLHKGYGISISSMSDLLIYNHNLTEIKKDATIYTKTDLVGKISEGSVAYYNEKYYITPNGTTQAEYNKPPGGVWIELVID